MSTPISQTLTLARPDSIELAERAASFRAAYVHVPFCARLCPYCDFAVVTGRDDEIPRYLQALRTEIERDDRWGPLDSVYFGGGTPSRANPDALRAVLDSLQARHGMTDDAEISLEANPEDWTPERAEALWEAGFNRVSFGAQSFDPATLLALGRRHDPAQIGQSAKAARTAGFDSINFDLIFGSPADTGWAKSLTTALAYEPDHLSCYALTVEPGTALFRQVAAGAPAPDPDAQAEQWELADAAATNAGLVRYEVSNWARAGHAVKYNLAVWAQAEYVAYGLGAHRFRHEVRSHNFRHLDKYLAAVEEGNSTWSGQESITGWSAETERVFLGIRRSAGVVAGAAGERLLRSEEGLALAEHGVIALEGDRLIVRRPLLTDAVARALLALSPP